MATQTDRRTVIFPPNSGSRSSARTRVCRAVPDVNARSIGHRCRAWAGSAAEAHAPRHAPVASVVVDLGGMQRQPLPACLPCLAGGQAQLDRGATARAHAVARAIE